MGKGKQKQTKRAALAAQKSGPGGPKQPQLSQRELKKQERNTRNRLRQERNIQRYGVLLHPFDSILSNCRIRNGKMIGQSFKHKCSRWG